MAFNWFRKTPPAPASTPDVPPAAPEPPGQAGGGFFRRLKNGLSKTRRVLTSDIDALFAGDGGLDEDDLETLEELLITADIGVTASVDIIERVRRRAGGIGSAADLKQMLRNEIRARLTSPPPEAPVDGPRVIMVVGVNGVGKTTTIGKLAARHTAAGRKVLIAAADTFRAAAVEQLAVWAERAGAELVRAKPMADPAAVAYDGLAAAASRGADIVLVDTAGRLHTKVNLMAELQKIRRALGKHTPEAPHEVLLVLDATTGQNGLAQAQTFHDALGVTGLAVTKLDGTAKGGIVVGVADALRLPVKYLGVGEQVADLQDFIPDDFVTALI